MHRGASPPLAAGYAHGEMHNRAGAQSRASNPYTTSDVHVQIEPIYSGEEEEEEVPVDIEASQAYDDRSEPYENKNIVNRIVSALFGKYEEGTGEELLSEEEFEYGIDEDADFYASSNADEEEEEEEANADCVCVAEGVFVLATLHEDDADFEKAVNTYHDSNAEAEVIEYEEQNAAAPSDNAPLLPVATDTNFEENNVVEDIFLSVERVHGVFVKKESGAAVLQRATQDTLVANIPTRIPAQKSAVTTRHYIVDKQSVAGDDNYVRIEMRTYLAWLHYKQNLAAQISETLRIMRKSLTPDTGAMLLTYIEQCESMLECAFADAERRGSEQ